MTSTSSLDPTLTASATATPTETNRGSNSGPSSPLLFFVALGFGVVFTNLWIIVGVKYCFRYNQRNRQRMAGEDPDAVDLGQLPRQHRRRREKKLMSIDEVNEKFPLTKYKTWRSTQAEKGLPTAGGINADSTSRPASIRDVSRESKDEAKHEELATNTTVSTSATADAPDSPKQEHGKPEEVGSSDAQPSSPRPKTATSTVPDTPIQKVTSNDGEDDEDDHIQIAVPTEQLPDPGDTCAICIDTLEDDDDVRGLACGHAFHASCVDPWLTSRRACCPLCKADYYVPKPRPDAAADGQSPAGQSPLTAPHFAFIGGRERRPTMVLPGRFMSIVYDERDRHGFPRVVREETPAEQRRRLRRELRQRERNDRQRLPSEATQGDDSPVVQQEERSGWRSRLRMPRLGGWRNGQGSDPNTLVASEGMVPNSESRNGQDRAPEVTGAAQPQMQMQAQAQTQTQAQAQAQAQTPNPEVTPSQLEAGQQAAPRT